MSLGPEPLPLHVITRALSLAGLLQISMQSYLRHCFPHFSGAAAFSPTPGTQPVVPAEDNAEWPRFVLERSTHILMPFWNMWRSGTLPPSHV